MGDIQPTVLSAAKLALAIKRIRSERSDVSLLASDPVAIVGIGCRFPGGVRSPEEYWKLLHDGVDAITPIPPSRWNADAFFDADPQASGKMNTRHGGFVPDVEWFDPLLFGIAPREAVSMDPQHRLLLEVAWEAIWNSGRSPESLNGSSTGVFIAEYNSDYSRLLAEDIEAIGPHTTAGGSHSIASGRISFLLDLHGPSISLDTACSSSLVAVHAACQSLRSAECDAALAGGVTLHLLPEHFVALAKLGMLAPDGRCKTFDSKANGFVPGEGCGVVVLKLLANALRDGDHVYAVIRGTAVNEDGRTNVLTAPNGLAQQELVRAALRNAQVSPSSISYIETHGTGTALGDPIEVEALANALGAHSSHALPCALGAVKSNIGHLEAASGIAGLIKATLALHNQEIPANLHYSELNPHIALEDTRFFIPTRPTAWPRGEKGRFAGVSSFGFGGTNAHIVLEEAPLIPQPRMENKPSSRNTFLLPISARTPEALKEFAKLYRDYLATEDASRAGLYNICHSAATRRNAYEERLAINATTYEEFARHLDDFIDGRVSRSISAGRASQESQGLVFVCSGQGSQWPRMGMSLFDREPVFRAAIQDCDAAIRRQAEWSLIDQLAGSEDRSKLQHTEYAQPAIFAIQVALARLWASWGIVPSAIIGHSAGEVAATHIAGVLDLEEAVRIVVHRGRLMEPATGQGKMAAVHLPLSAVCDGIKGFGDKVSVAATNSPESTVISGDPGVVRHLMDEWLRNGTGCRMLPVDYAFHSAQMQPFSNELAKVLGTVRTNKQTIPIISTVLGVIADGAQFDAAYWASNVRLPVLFSTAVNEAARLGFRAFLEIGPHPVLLANIGECLGKDGRCETLVPSLHRGHDEMSDMLSSLGKLYVAGYPFDWHSLYSMMAPAVSLPVYPYQRQKYWIARRPKATTNALHPLLGRRLRSPALLATVFEAELSVSNLPYLADHRIEGSILLPMTAFLEIAHAAVLHATGESRALLDVTVLNPLVLAESGSCTVQAVIDGDRVQILSLDDSEWKLHFSCRSDKTTAPSELHSFPQLSTGSDTMDPAAFYKRLRDNRTEFGPSFLVLENLRARADQALGRVRLDKREQNDAGRYRVHPALLDGCFQSVIAALPQDFSGTYLPFSIDRFETFAAAGPYVYAHVRLTDLHGNSELLSADVDLVDDGGTPVAAVRGLHFKRGRTTASVNKNIYQVNWHRVAPRLRTTARAGTWLILTEDLETGQSLSDAMKTRGQETVVLKPDAPLDALDVFNGVIRIFTGSAAGSCPDQSRDACASLLRLSQLLARSSNRRARLCVVTREAASVLPTDRCEGISQAVTWGFGRTIAMEHPDFNCRRMDLDADPANFAMLAEEICSELGEEEIAFRGAERYVPRLEKKLLPEAGARRLTVHSRGSLENIATEPMERRAPLAGEVEVEVETTGLNFRDVLNVLGTYPGDPGPLGLEFCGRISRVGPGVAEHKPGDRVMGIAWGSFASYINTPAGLVVSVPVGLTPAEAVSIPNAFLTAHHCLVELGGIKRGDRVLIHAATGGVGLAALQVAQRAGAEIFATAGSEPKREYLRSLGVRHVFSSRTLDFANEIREITGGAGVDLILNSLSGDFIAANFRVLANRGRFIEIGKTGIWSQEKVAELGKSFAYDIVDLSTEINTDQERVQRYLWAIRESIIEGTLRPLPTCVFEFNEATLAFRHMARAKHIGKIVVRHAPPLRLAPDSSYLITGGLGAIGLQLAEWMVSQGARNLVVVGRRGPDSQALSKIEKMREAGARVETRELDVSNRTQLQSLLGELCASLAPLRGLVHCAGIVDDGVIAQQTPERFERVLSPKVTGAWHLHELTQSLPLDFFVLCSSVAAVTGSPSQSAYSAANAFLDALAHFRRSRGLPALSINWGAWSEGGMASRVEAAGRRRVLSGVRTMRASEYFKCFEVASSAGASQLMIADIDWTQWKNPPDLISGLTNKNPEPELSTSRDDILTRLQSVPPLNRRKFLVDFLREEAYRILGLSDSHFIDERQSLIRMGLDSLMAVEFRNRLAAAFNRQLSSTLLFDYPTLGGLADYLDPRPLAPEPAVSDPLLGSLESLTDIEAEQLLNEELRRAS